MVKMKVRIVNTSNNELPKYETEGSAGMDLRANLEEPVSIEPGVSKLIPTGLHIELPEGYEAQIRPRSGLALKHGITVLNTPGTIDTDYRGDIGVILINHSNSTFSIQPGERIAQMVISAYQRVEWSSTEELAESARGTGGFGHTGK